jgi:hypothetical protein
MGWRWNLVLGPTEWGLGVRLRTPSCQANRTETYIVQHSSSACREEGEHSCLKRLRKTPNTSMRTFGAMVEDRTRRYKNVKHSRYLHAVAADLTLPLPKYSSVPSVLNCSESVSNRLILFLARVILILWWWRRQVPPKRRYTINPHGTISQKTAFFRSVTDWANF